MQKTHGQILRWKQISYLHEIPLSPQTRNDFEKAKDISNKFAVTPSQMQQSGKAGALIVGSENRNFVATFGFTRPCPIDQRLIAKELY